MNIKNIIFFVLSIYVIFVVYVDMPKFETFENDLSLNHNKIIYNTNPYANSTLFYNPLDFWVNPYLYYNLYNLYSYPLNGYSTNYTNPVYYNHNYSRRYKYPRHSRHSRYHRHPKRHKK